MSEENRIGDGFQENDKQTADYRIPADEELSFSTDEMARKNETRLDPPTGNESFTDYFEAVSLKIKKQEEERAAILNKNTEISSRINTGSVSKKGGGSAVAVLIIVVVLCCSVILGSLIAGAAYFDGTATHGSASSAPSGSTSENTTGSSPGKGNGSSIVLAPPSGNGALSYKEVAKKVTPSVVRILISVNGAEASLSGTGFIITSDGYILTNDHVVNHTDKGSVSIIIMTYEDNTYEATLVGSDSTSDIALLKIEAVGLPAAELGDSDALEVGDEVIAVGNPHSIELSYTTTKGIVSGLRKNITLGTYRSMDLIQTDTPINPGNSGGPLINLYGQIVGINSMKITSFTSTTIEGLGFAIPINTVKDMLDDLRQYGYKRGRPSLGVINVRYVSETYSSPEGVLIGGTSPGTDAEAKGLMENDIITHINGKHVTSLNVLVEERDKYKPGDEIEITYYRNRRSVTIKLVLGELQG